MVNADIIYADALHYADASHYADIINADASHYADVSFVCNIFIYLYTVFYTYFLHLLRFLAHYSDQEHFKFAFFISDFAAQQPC